MKPDSKTGKRQKLTSVLGLALDGSRLDGVVLKRTNGSLQPLQSFTAQLTLDPLTAAPELVAREIHNHLAAAGAIAQVPEDVRAGVQAHLDQHFTQLKLTPPWKRGEKTPNTAAGKKPTRMLKANSRART